ncbi:hypothetical protein DYB26_006126 [Aphanomyces astaci]|uniref:GP-PDE domain-containing protein n=1 Tax=Aphanomyces astaci TaxID=112090 RepID=A0A3R6XYC3_APHAT|nr:hypothetical protein DYB26_006126 [Aphanomyces astaci]
MAFGRSRHVVFSCFAPDVCVLLRAKQSTYRVYFLTCGVDVEHLVWDTRCIALNHAVAFSQVEQLHGIVTNSDPLLDKPALIPAIKNNTQLDVFTWGDHNTSHAHYVTSATPSNEHVAGEVQRQKKHGVDGVISDNIGDLTLRDGKPRPREVGSMADDTGRL